MPLSRRPAVVLAASALFLAAPAVGFAQGVPSTVPTATPTTSPSVAKAIAELAADDYQARERASRQLFAYGLAAEPALRQAAVESGLPEVRNRAKRILNHFAHGIFADTPDEVVAAADRYPQAAASEKRNIIRQLAGQGGYGYLVLTRLAEEEPEGDLHDFITRLIATESNQVANTAALRLMANDTEAAERILGVAARSGEEPTARAYAALMLELGRLGPAIDSLQAHFASAAGGERRKAARTLAYLLRAAGRLDEAGAAANASGDPAAVNAIAIDAHDWRTLAGSIARHLPPPGSSQQSPGELGVLAAAQQWGGDVAACERTLDQLVAVAQGNDAAVQGAAHALLLNGRFDRAVALLRDKQRYAPAFDLLFFTGRYDEALAVADRAKADRHGEAPALAAGAARVHWRLGLRDKALAGLDAVAASLADAPTFDLATHAALCDAERDVGRTEPAVAAKARQHAIAALNAAPPNTQLYPLFERLFPGGGSRAMQWWETLRQLRPNEPVEGRFDTMTAILNRTIPAAEFDALARSAVNQAWLQRLNDNAARERVLQLLGDTLVRAGRPDEAGTYFDMLATQRVARNAWVEVGLRYVEKGEFTEAAAYFDRAGSAADAVWLRGFALGKSGDAEGAARWQALARRRTLGDERQLAALATAMEAVGDADGARAERQRILRLGTPRTLQYFQACQQLGDAAAHRGDMAAAADHWQTFLLTTMQLSVNYTDPSSYVELPVLVHHARARALYRAGPDGIPAAAEQFRAALAMAPTRLRMPLECVAEMRALARERPDGQPYEAAARALHDDVAARLTSQLDRYPQSAYLHNELAWLHARCDYDLDDALAHANRAVEIAPRDTFAIDTLAEVHAHRGDRAKAVELMRQCEALEPGQPRHAQRRAEFEKPAG